MGSFSAKNHSPFLCTFCSIRERQQSGDCNLSAHRFSPVLFFARRAQEKRILFWGIYRSEILLPSCTICRLKTSSLSAPLYPKYILSGRKPALTRHFKAAISRHTKLQKARPFPFGLAFSLQPYFSRQIKERRANALRSVPSHKGCYTVGGVQSKKIDWKG